MHLLGIFCLVVATAALPVLPDPPKLSNSVEAHQDSKIHTFQIQNAATASAPFRDEKDNEKVEKDLLKIASVVFSPTRQLPPFYDSILKKHKADRKQIYDDHVKLKVKNSKREKESVVPEKSLEVEILPDPGRLTNLKKGFNDCEVCANILIVTSGSAPVADKKDDDTVKSNIVMIPSIFIPTPPELSKYSFLKNQTAEQKQKSYNVMKQKAEKSKRERETVILDQEKSALVELPPNPGTFLDSETAPQDSEIRDVNLSVTPDSAPVADNEYNEDEKHSIAKLASVVMPPPPELPPFDYSILRKQKTDLNLKPKYFAKQSAEKHKEDKKTVIVDLEKHDQVEVPLPGSEVISDGDNGEAKMNMVKVDPIVIPTPPELPPFDYSILRKQKADLKSDFSTKQSTEKYEEDKETVIVDLEKQVKTDVPPNPPTLPDFELALPGSEVIIDGDNGETNVNMVKVAPIVIPPPPELPQFDYSVLKKQLSNQKQKYNDALMQETKKSKEDTEVVISDLASLPDSVDALPVSEVITSSKSSNEEAKVNMVKMASIHIPPPPELPPFDYSILRKQKADNNLKSDFSTKQSTEKYKEDKETVIVDLEKQVKIDVPPNPPTLSDSLLALPGSEKINDGDNVEEKINMVKIAPIVIPPPPELPQFDYSVFKKQIASQKQKYNDALMQGTKISKEEKEEIIPYLEKSFQVGVPRNSAILIESVIPPQDAEVPATILGNTTDSAPVADNEYDEDEKHSIARIASVVMPPPPELPPFDYSILRKQKTDQNLKSEYSAKQSAEKYEEDKESVIVDLEKQVKIKLPPSPPTLPDSVLELPVSENINYGDNVDAKINMVKVAPIVIPPPPELPQFDYSVLKKQLANQKQKYNDALMQETKKSKEDTEVVISDLASLPDSVDALPVSEVITSSKSSNEEAKVNMVKMASIHIPPPPELPPFDYSTLRKQKADNNLKSDFYTKQSNEKYKEEKETVIVDLEKQVKIKVPPNPPTLPNSVLALPVSEKINDGDSVEAKINMVKVAPIVIPPPPELPQFDYSVLKKQIGGQKQKFNDVLIKQEAEKSKREKGFDIGKPVEIKVDEPKLVEKSKFVGISKPIDQFKPVEEFKPSEVLIKKPVKHSEDIPVVIQLTIPSAPLLSKLTSNCPPLPGFGLNLPYKRFAMSRCPHLIYPKFDIDGKIYTN